MKCKQQGRRSPSSSPPYYLLGHTPSHDCTAKPSLYFCYFPQTATQKALLIQQPEENFCLPTALFCLLLRENSHQTVFPFVLIFLQKVYNFYCSSGTRSLGQRSWFFMFVSPKDYRQLWVLKLEVCKFQCKDCKEKGKFVIKKELAWHETTGIRNNGSMLASLYRMLEMKRLKFLLFVFLCACFAGRNLVKPVGIVLSSNQQPCSCHCLLRAASLSLLCGLVVEPDLAGHLVILMCYTSAGISVSTHRS